MALRFQFEFTIGNKKLEKMYLFDTGATYSECPAINLKLLSEPIVETFSDNPLKENVTAVWEHIPFFGKTKCMKQHIL